MTTNQARGEHTMGTGEYLDVNGLRMCYKIHGSGRPLVPCTPRSSTRRRSAGSATIRRDAVHPEILQQRGQVAAAEFMKDTLLGGGLRDGGRAGRGGRRGVTHYDIFSSPLFTVATLAVLNRP